MTASAQRSGPRMGRRLSRGRALLLVAIGLALGLLLASFVVTIGRDPGVLRPVTVDRPAPPLAGRTVEGGRFDLASLSGKLAVVNFWATWCSECRREHPAFVRIAERYRGQPVALVGVVFQDDPEAVRQYMRTMGGEWPNVEDPTSRIAIDYGVYGVPETFLIDGGGVIRAKIIGRIDERTLRAWIDTALAGMARG